MPKTLPMVLAFVLMMVLGCSTKSNLTKVGPAPDADVAADVAVSASAVLILTLGDSLTEGVGDSEWTEAGAPVGYPGRLEARLKASGIDATVQNLGRSGWTSTDLLRGVTWNDPPEPSQMAVAQPLIAAALAAKAQVVVTVWIGSNDLFGLYDWCHEPDHAECEAGALAEYTANIDETLSTLIRPQVTVLIALLDDQSKRPVVTDPKYAGSFPNIGAAERALMSAQVQAFNQVIAAKATLYGARTVDFQATTLFEQASTLADDGNHPNAAGYEQIAAVWEPAVRAALAP